MVIFTQEQNTICKKPGLLKNTVDEDSITHVQTIICRRLFACHLVDSRTIKRKKNASNDNKQLLDEVEHDIMNYQTEVCVIC